MSNEIVGKIYSEVIEGVIAESRQDFEDSGIDEATLQELKEIWQQRLSSFGVAKLPWDQPEQVQEPPQLPPPTGTAPAAPSDGKGESLKNDQQQQLPTTISAPPGIVLPTLSSNGGEIRVKTEANANGGGLVLPGGGHIAQADGPGDDDLDDSDPDGINSDLDDSDDGLNSAAEDDDDDGGMIMLCLYDKVQRVKNKWKYVLKDGVANINGKDYVFSRGSGESEW